VQFRFFSGIDLAAISSNNGGMLLLLIAGVLLAFLFVGAIAFVASALIPPARRFALSAALWCAVCGPCALGWVFFAGLGMVAKALVIKGGSAQVFHSPRLVEAFGWTYLIVAILSTAAAATGLAWLHQKVVRRFTFALFRIYAAMVTAGIGGVLGLAFAFWRQSAGTPPFDVFGWIAGMLILAGGFGYMAYKHARRLRGEAPTRFTWISAEEYMDIDHARR
jgi:hypothetical protein